MTHSDLKNLVEYLLKKNYIIYAPIKKSGQIIIDRIFTYKNFTLTRERPLYSFKKYLLPPRESLFNFSEKNKGAVIRPKQALLGITVYDLRAIALLAQVFEKDPYFQNIISNTLLIGQSPVPGNTTFYEKYEENVLEHFKFDIFLESRGDRDNFRIFTGSKHGQRLLNEFGYNDFEHIEYAGPIPEEGLSEFHKITREKIKKSYDNAIWKSLGKRCLGCEKCTIVCPTCFCFKFYDASSSFDITHDKSLGANTPAISDANSNKEGFSRYREWDSCFNAEFSEISGGAKFLKTIQNRIYNYYDHKFVRIPTEYNLPGCVGCGRCSDVCPAGINIKEVIAKIQKINPRKIKKTAAKKLINKPKVKTSTPKKSKIPFHKKPSK